MHGGFIRVTGENADMEQPTCHRRDCDRPAVFVVTERYEEETGQGTVNAEAPLCFEHTQEEHPHNLDQAGTQYRFLVEPIEGVDPAAHRSE